MSVKATDRKAGTYTVCELIEHSTSFEDAAAVIIQPTKSYSKPIRQTISFSIGSRENDLVVACYAHSGGDVILRICHLLRVADAGPSIHTYTHIHIYTYFHIFLLLQHLFTCMHRCS